MKTHPSTQLQIVINNFAIALIITLLPWAVALDAQASEVRQGMPTCRVTSNYDTCNKKSNKQVNG